jgi:putative peptide zinc metalloprotease protein
MRPLLSWFGVILWIAVVVGAIASIAPRWTDLQAAASSAIDPSNWIFLWASFVLIKVIHELGHGFACRRFGGEVHEMGIMFLVLVPCPYVDASTAWGFPNKWARIFVGTGGMIFELFIAAIMAFVWLNTNDTMLINKLAYNVMLIASVSTVIFNANPLLRYDGYYILSDWLEIPNLRNKSTEYTMGLFKRHLFRVKSHIPLPPIKQRFWLVFFAIASTIYRTLIGIAIILMVWQKVPVLGVLMAIAGVITFLAVPFFKLGKYLLLDAELHRKRARAYAWTGGIAAGIFILLGYIPFPVHYETLGIIEPIHRPAVVAGETGIVEQLLAQDGQMVEQGQAILVCRNYVQELEMAQLRAQLRALAARRDFGIAADQTMRQMVDRQIRVTEEELQKLQEQQKQLTIRAPRSGRLSVPMLNHLQGRHLRKGEEIGFVASCEGLRIVTCIDQNDAAMVYFKDLRRGSQADVRPAGSIWTWGSGIYGWRKLKATIEQLGEEADGDWRRPTPTWEVHHPALILNNGGNAEVDPTDPEGRRLVRPYVNVFLTMPNDGEEYLPGQRARVRFEIDRQALMVNWSRRIRQVLQAHSRGKWT